MNMYGRTKLFNIMSSTEFNRRLKGTGVESFSCHPGVAKTDLYHPDKMDKDKLSSKVIGALWHSLAFRLICGVGTVTHHCLVLVVSSVLGCADQRQITAS